jgi:hypothetical protein
MTYGHLRPSIFIPLASQTPRLSLLLLRLLEHLLDDLLLFDQESTNNTILDAVGAS